MGKCNSSKCVVKPVFDELLKDNKLISFLEFVLPKEIEVGTINEEDVFYEGHPREKALPPAPEFLEWCRKNPDKLVNPELARKKLDDDRKYIFEGKTHPDVYVETSTLRIVIEAKWTEPRITSHTTWRKEGERDQLIRHMDALFPFREQDGKPFYGLYLIDDCGKISKIGLQHLFRSEWYVTASLPHRTKDEVSRLVKESFCGVFTWQEIKQGLSLSSPNFCK